MQKVFVITGTRKGIGKFLSEYYLKQGFVVCGCSRKEASINHKNYRHFELDVSDEKAVVAMIRQIKKEFNRIDTLINNAGIAAMNHILTTPKSSAQSIFQTNVIGSFLFLREVAKVMMKHKDTKNLNIVNFSTIATPLRLEGEAIYAASKAAIINITQTCAKELAPFNIRVNAIAPTPIKTDLIKNISQEQIDKLLAKQALQRLGEFKDVVNVIDFFIDEKSNFITGQTLYLGGVFE